MVSWQKEQTDANRSSSWLAVNTNEHNSRYSMSRIASPSAQNVSGNSSVAPTGPSYVLNVENVQGPKDFGRYRCRAENALGVVHSIPISLTGNKGSSGYYSVIFGKKPNTIAVTI